MVWFLKKCSALKLLSTFLLLLVSSHSYATIYYLKFTSSGATHDGTSTFKDNVGAYLEVSIVDSFPTDGPVHWKNSQTGSFTFENANKHKKIEGTTNNLHYYYADVPRSITIIDNSSGTQTTITHGNAPVKFSSAPSFLLPDGMLVAPGLSHNPRKIYVAAAMPIRRLPAYEPFSGYDFRGGLRYKKDTGKNDFSCLQGWSESVRVVGEVEIWQAVYDYLNSTSVDGQCATSKIYRGKLSHIVLER